MAFPSTVDESPADESLYEVVDGQRVELPPMGVYEVFVASRLGSYLDVFVTKQKLGRVVVEALFDLAIGGKQRRPDVAFVSYQRWPRDRQIPREEDAWPVVPNAAIEVVSKNNKANEIATKVDEYFRAGVELVWVIWPKLEKVYVYTTARDIHILSRTDELDGGNVLPGFRLAVANLFDDVEN